jgi:hypothetical protein
MSNNVQFRQTSDCEFCRSCDGFTGRMPGDLADVEEVAQNWLQRCGVHIHPVAKPSDVEQRRRRRKVFLLNHSAE